MCKSDSFYFFFFFLHWLPYFVCARELSWRPEDSLLELVLSVHHMVSELELRSTWVVTLGGKCLCLLGRVASPSPVFPKGACGSAQHPIFAVLVFLKTGSCCATQEPLNLLCNSGQSGTILLPQLPKCWGYRYAPRLAKP